jgi:hypothetical protein
MEELKNNGYALDHDKIDLMKYNLIEQYWSCLNLGRQPPSEFETYTLVLEAVDSINKSREDSKIPLPDHS